MGDSDDWLEFIPYFSEDYYCLFVDLPGHGQSIDVYQADYSMEKTAESIFNILDDNTKEKSDLISYSMGGRIGLYLAVYYPERFDKIVIESASPGLKTDTERQNRIEQDKLIAEKLLSQSINEFLEFWYNQPVISSLDKSTPKFHDMLQKRMKNDPQKLKVSLEQTGLGQQPSLWEKLAQIKSDILLIVGQKDSKFQTIAQAMKAGCYNMNLEIIADAGHNVHFEQPDKYIEVVNKFLKNK